MSREEFARKHPFFTLPLLDQRSPGEAFVAEENRDEVRRILNREEVRRLIPADLQFLWSAKPVRFQDGTNYYVLYPVKASPELTGGVITTARATTDPGTNQYVVTMAMDDQGSRDWSRITGANINKRIAIVLDNGVFSAPVVRSKITGGNSQIEGMENLDEARLLEIVLKAGALPAPGGDCGAAVRRALPRRGLHPQRHPRRPLGPGDQIDRNGQQQQLSVDPGAVAQQVQPLDELQPSPSEETE